MNYQFFYRESYRGYACDSIPLRAIAAQLRADIVASNGNGSSKPTQPADVAAEEDVTVEPIEEAQR